MDIDGPACFRIKTRIKKTLWIVQGRAGEEIHFHMILKRSDCYDISVVRPDGRIPFPIFRQLRGGCANDLAQMSERFAAPIV
jgi:hypothetical protein